LTIGGKISDSEFIMEDYTVFIKLLSHKTSSDEIKERIVWFVEKYGATRLNSVSYEFSNPEENMITLWSDLKKIAGEDLNAILLRHQNLGIGAYPLDLQVELIGLPKTDLDTHREQIEAKLGTMP